jgi:hypothetical protein
MYVNNLFMLIVYSDCKYSSTSVYVYRLLSRNREDEVEQVIPVNM